jgi:NAD-dependent deacetylase
MLVVGSSLVVQPAASLPVITLEHGGQVIIVNVGETPLDRVAAVKIDADAAEVLPRLQAALPPP